MAGFFDLAYKCWRYNLSTQHWDSIGEGLCQELKNGRVKDWVYQMIDDKCARREFVLFNTYLVKLRKANVNQGL